MENPMYWTSTHWLIYRVMREHQEEADQARLLIGLSLESKIYDALKVAGLLKEDEMGTPTQLLVCNCGDCTHWEIGKNFIKCKTCDKVLEATISVNTNDMAKFSVTYKDKEV